MKKLLTLLTAAVGATVAFAATPAAVWDGDFTATQTGFTLNRSGNAISQDNSTITIDQSVGVKVDFTTGFASAMTVMFKYSDLAFDAQKTLATSFCSGGDENRTGVYAASGGTINGIWNTGNWAHPAQTLSASSGVLAFCYSKTAGTSLYSVGASSRSELYNESGLKSGNDTAINGCTIGGERAKSGATLLSAATGMKITGIAIFDGILTEAEMTGYVWPSETQTINVSANTSVSAINAQYDSTTYKAAKVTVTSGVMITVDEAFSTALPIAVSSTGSITLSAESQPDASYFTGVDFSGVQGAVLRSWLPAPGVVGFNFYSGRGTDTSAALVAGTWQANASDASGTADLFGDGLSVLAWGSSLYSRGSSTFLDGYIDDAWSGNGATITLSNVPYETYDVVIYASTDSGSVFTAKTVNGTAYTWNAVQSAAVQGSETWGSVGVTSAIYGVNSLRIKNLSGPLTIYGGSRTNQARGGIAAIQIMPPTAEDIVKTYTLTLDGTVTTWSAGTWTLDGATVSAPTAGNVVINATASTTLTLDADVTLGDVTVNGGANIVVNLALGEKTAASGDTAATYYSFYAGKVAVESGVLQQGSVAVLGTTPVVMVADGATFDLNAFAMNAATAVYVEGAGAGNWPWALTSSGGAFAGTIQNMYLSGNATVGGEYKIVLGADWAGSYCYLQNHTLVKTGTGELLVRNLNIPDDGTVIVRSGELHTDQWNCLNKNTSGTVTLKIEADGTVRGTNQQSNPPAATTLDWEGTLNTASRTFIVKSALSGGGTTANLNFEANATANLKRDLTITSSLTLSGDASFLKDAEATADVTVSPATLAASGTITVGSGVTFNVGTSRPTATIYVQNGGTLAAQLQSASDVIELSTSAQPANVILYDANGNVVSNPRISYSDGTLTIMPPVPVLEASGTVAFDTAANWVDSLMPGNDGDAIIELSDDATITVSGTYTLGSLTITGSGVVTFSGNGTITAANISVKNGATFTRGANISATTGISLDSGTVLRLDGVTESAVISGAGAVETYNNVTFGSNNTFTGGLTVKTGTASTTAAGGFGGKEADGIYSVTVEDGACLDIANTANYTHSLTIAGKGVRLANGAYSGAVKNSGSVAYGSGTRQTRSIALTDDALVDVSAGWGIVRSAHNEAALALNGHTLTIRGTGTVPMVNVNASGSTGTLVLDGATLELSNAASNLAGVNVVAKGCATINVATAPSALGSLTLKPTATGTTSSNWNLPSGFVPKVDTSNINQTGLSDGQVLTLFTAPSGTTLSSETISVSAGGRFTTAISGNTVTATFSAAMPAPFMHYDFNAANSIAADSLYNFGNLNPTFVHARNGMGGVFDSSYKPYYGSNNSGKSPFYAGEMTVTTLLKVQETNNTILWNFGSAFADGMALVAKDSSTISVVSWTGGATGSDVVSMTGINNLVGKWHLVTIVADVNGTTLYVDGQSATTATVIPANIGGQGQFGSIHGSAKNYTAVSGDGFILDDWRVYDAALTADDIKTLRKQFLPKPMVIRLR